MSSDLLVSATGSVHVPTCQIVRRRYRSHRQRFDPVTPEEARARPGTMPCQVCRPEYGHDWGDNPCPRFVR